MLIISAYLPCLLVISKGVLKHPCYKNIRKGLLKNRLSPIVPDLRQGSLASVVKWGLVDPGGSSG